MKKILVTYIYSQNCQTASYLEFLIDKVRSISYVQMEIICIEHEDYSDDSISKMEKELAKLIKKENYGLATDVRQRLNRKLITKKYQNTLPLIKAQFSPEHELCVTGSKKALSSMLDYIANISIAVDTLNSIDFSGFEEVIRKVVTEVNKGKTAAEGLETTQSGPDVT